MLVGLHGLLELRGNNWVIVRVGGISFQVSVPALTLKKLGKLGGEVDLHTHLHWKGDGFALYGFATGEELHLFQSLLGVTGVGPRLALSLLSTLTVDQLTRAIMSGDAALLSEVPGIGKKIAGRLLLELRSKLEKGGLPVLPGVSEDRADVIAALTSLGYSAMEAVRSAEALPEGEMSLEDKVKQAL
ncbi:MAG: Holliday junction helicase subunit RuvA [Dehalococcoidia bacterium]|nr:Holliday junction helicase subunit RuvA [Dehalococcoidia bacterium]